jgi:glycosyltransferase involved in cell wall biosynthesis
VKITLLSHFFPPTHNAGTETYTYGLAKQLRQLGQVVNVVCSQDWDRWCDYRITATEDVFDSIPVRRLHHNWAKAPDPAGYLYNNPEVYQHLTEYLGELQPDVVHFTSCYTLSGSAILAAKQLGLPVVLTLTDFWFLCPRHTLLRSDGSLCSGYESAAGCLGCMAKETKVWRIVNSITPRCLAASILAHLAGHPFLTKRRGLRGLYSDFGARARFLRGVLDQVDKIIAPSKFLAKTFVHNGLPPWRILVAGYGQETSWARRIQRIESASLRIGYVGQIEPIKGVHLLISAARRIDSAAIEVVIHGDLTRNPGYARELRRLAEGDPRVKFCGPFPKSELPSVFAGLDVLAVPSLWYENGPVVIGEAFAARIPVIATNLGGISEFVEHGVNGLLFDRGDVPGLSAALQLLVEDPALLGRLRNGIPQVRTLEEDAAELLGLYDHLITNRAGELTCLNQR